MRGVQLSLGRSPGVATFQHTSYHINEGRAWGRLSSPPPGRFRQSRRRICRAEIRRTEGVEASALGRETRNTQDNNYYHLRTTQRAFMQRVQRCTVLRVRAGAGEWRGPWQRFLACFSTRPGPIPFSTV